MKIGIIGHGFIGQALTSWLRQHNPDAELCINDPPKGLVDDVSDCDAYFVQIHIPTEQDGSQDLSTLRQIICSLPKGKPIWLRTTVLPGTSALLSKETGRTVYHMPEFLTQRTHIEDFEKQTSVFTGDIWLLRKIFPGKRHIIMTSEEAELAKYAHNVFGALKVTYFNCLYDLCQQLGFSYRNVLDGVLASEYINETHTAVPGPDGMFGYGGKCFPKDVKAAAAKYKDTLFGKLIAPLEEINSVFRQEEN